MTVRFNRNGKKGVLHYVTINVREHRQAFRADIFARAACKILRLHCDNHPAKLIAFVIMPDHIHMIINPQDGDINKFLSQLKPAISNCVAKIALAQNNQRILNWLYDNNLHRNRLWQDGKYNFHLFTERLIWQKINYLHTNPIKRGLVQKAADYPFSSYRQIYEIEEEIIIPVDKDFWWENLEHDDRMIK